LKLKDNFTTNSLDFFSFETEANVRVVKKDGSYIDRDELLKDNFYTFKEIRKEHNIQKMLKAGAFKFKNPKTEKKSFSRKYMNLPFLGLVILFVALLLEIISISTNVELPIKNIQLEKHGNVYMVKKINNLILYNQNYFIEKDISNKKCTFIGNKSYIFSELINPDVFEIKCHGKKIERIILPNQKLTVEEALMKHNMKLTERDRLETLYIHFWGHNKGKSLFIILMAIVFVAYLITHLGSVLLLGLFASLIISSIIGIYGIFYDKSDPADGFYKKIEKRTGEKIIRNYDFF